MSDIEYDIDMTAKCNYIRDYIHGEVRAKELEDKWHAMAKTSTIQRRIKNEVGNVQVNVSFNKR